MRLALAFLLLTPGTGLLLLWAIRSVWSYVTSGPDLEDAARAQRVREYAAKVEYEADYVTPGQARPKPISEPGIASRYTVEVER